jgi:hypothetical protein
LIISAVVLVYGLVSVFSLSADQWEAAGRKRRNWIVMMCLFGPLAVLLFFGTVRQQIVDPERFVAVDGVAPADQ